MARPAAAVGSAVSMPSATTDAPSPPDSVEQHAGVALLPQLHRLAAVPSGVREAERGEQLRDGRAGGGVDGDLGEREPVQLRGGRRIGAAASGAVASRSASRERRASTAARRGSDWRKTSLNTSSDSGPV